MRARVSPPAGYLTIGRIRNACDIAASINSRTPRNFLRVIAVIYNGVGNEMRERLSSENGRDATRIGANRGWRWRKKKGRGEDEEVEEGRGENGALLLSEMQHGRSIIAHPRNLRRAAR